MTSNYEPLKAVNALFLTKKFIPYFLFGVQDYFVHKKMLLVMIHPEFWAQDIKIPVIDEIKSGIQNLIKAM